MKEDFEVWIHVPFWCICSDDSMHEAQYYCNAVHRQKVLVIMDGGVILKVCATPESRARGVIVDPEWP